MIIKRLRERNLEGKETRGIEQEGDDRGVVERPGEGRGALDRERTAELRPEGRFFDKKPE